MLPLMTAAAPGIRAQEPAAKEAAKALEPEPPPPQAQAQAQAQAPDFSKKGAAHLAGILNKPWAGGWTGAVLENVRRVPPKPGMAFATKLPAAWHARIAGPGGKSGYLLWEDGKQGGLLEFALDDRLDIDAPNARALPGVTALQQFPLPGRDGGKPVASGCVPTAGASVFDFWLRRGQAPAAVPADGKDAGNEAGLRDLTLKLRARINMMAIPDRDGFTEDGMDLAGANPAELAKAIQSEADARGLAVRAKFGAFSFDLLKAEINAGRPALLSCVVRVPHKPELSWGHEVAATGWAELGGARFAGILDNFYPIGNPAAVRWIREEAFQSLITVKPAEKE